MGYKVCVYCQGRVFEGDRKCPSCGSAVFVFDDESAQREQARDERACSRPAPVIAPPKPQVVYAEPQVIYVPTRSTKNRWVALLLCFLLGYVGAHRFYVGKTASGVVWLLTCGFFGIGAIVDFLMILFGNFHDKSGLPLNG